MLLCGTLSAAGDYTHHLPKSAGEMSIGSKCTHTEVAYGQVHTYRGGSYGHTM